MVLVMRKSYADMRKRVGKKKLVMGRVVIGGAPGWMSTIWEGVKKVAPYVLPAAAPFALQWLFGRKKDEAGPAPSSRDLPQSLSDIASLGLDKASTAVSGMMPKEMLEMMEMMKEMRAAKDPKKPKKPKKLVEDDEDEDMEVAGEGMKMGKGTRRKIKKLIHGNGLFLHS